MKFSFAWALLAICAVLPAEAFAEKKDTTVIVVGGSEGDGFTATLSALEARLRDADPKGTVVVFTGNYGHGEMPESSADGRAAEEIAVRAHVLATQAFFARGGAVYFVAGDRDFAGSGTRAVRRLRKFLNKEFEAALGGAEREVDVMPQAACGTPTQLELTKGLGVLLVNSQWWMQDFRDDRDFNEGCEVKTRFAFNQRLTDAYREFRSRRLIIVSHHPLDSYGERGGAFTAAAHVDPFPIAGTAWVLARQAGLVPQYRNHPLVNSWVQLLFDEAQRNGAYVFASGHDTGLQFLRFGAQTQIVSGTSARSAGRLSGAREGDVAIAAAGWVELEVSKSGEGEVRLVPAGADVTKVALPPVRQISAAVEEAPAPLPAGPVEAGYSKRPTWKIPGVLQLLLGSFYGDAFALRLPYDVLNLEAEGFEPFKVGGGLQTNSVRVHDAQGGDWAIRSTTKDPGRVLPWPLNELSAGQRLLDQGFTASHPEGALAVPGLATAIGVLHQRPRLLYLPDQAALGPYRGFITNEVVMLELRPKSLDDGVLPEHLAGKPPAEGKTKFESYEELLEKMIDKPHKHRLDQAAMLRARLLDVLVGDWDRHRGQWAFAGIPGEDGVRTYQPIPRDRDQAFANYDGLGLMVARLIVPQARSLQPYSGSVGRLGWLNYNARDVDALMLNQLTHEQWKQIASEVKAKLTDDVIAASFDTWHPEARALDGDRLAAALKQRRDALEDTADDFYALISRNVDVVGSSHDDTFDLTFLEHGGVQVVVQGKKNGVFYDRVFRPEETDEVRLYALEGDDKLIVHGTPHRKIGVRFIGGEGKDAVTASAPMEATAIWVYDSMKGVDIDPAIAVRDLRSNLAYENQYDPWENHEPDSGAFMPGFRINPDDGAAFGGVFTYVVQGYKKKPFASMHTLTGYVSTGTPGVSLAYRGLFPQSADLLDQQVDLELRTPGYTRNFYGITNERADAPGGYYRLRQGHYEARYGLSYGLSDGRSRIGAQLVGQAVDTELTPGRFVSVSPDVTANAIGLRYYGGARIFAETNTYDSLTLPRRGVALHASAQGRYGENQFSTTYKLAAAIAIPLDRSQRFVILTRAGLEGIVGEHPFYFAPTLGDQQLRAYHPQQLAGDVAFSHSTDLRIDVFRFSTVLPGTVGVVLSADHGRVFGPTLVSSDYHLNLGGGLWWSIADLFGVSATFHQGLDGGSRFSVLLGPLFTTTGF